MKKRDRCQKQYQPVSCSRCQGGLQDAYTCYCRGKGFANAQTGNIILLGHYGMSGDFAGAVRWFSSSVLQHGRQYDRVFCLRHAGGVFPEDVFLVMFIKEDLEV